ncbi:N-acetylmuramoyl-L-alanine amidase family protein [Falseniella ignava]
MKKEVKSLALLGLFVAILTLLVLPQSGRAFELKEYWTIKGGIQYENGKVAKINPGYPVDIEVSDLAETANIQWTVSLNGQDQTQNFLGQEKDKSITGKEGRFLHFYVPYGYRGELKVEAKSGEETKTWTTRVVDSFFSEDEKSSYYRLTDINGDRTDLDSKWDAVSKSYSATLPDNMKGKTVVAWKERDKEGIPILHMPGNITRRYDSGGMFVELEPVFDTEGWLEEGPRRYYQRQGKLIRNDWVQYKGNWYFMDGAGGMEHDGWICSEDIWYYFKSSGVMASQEWIYDQGKWYFVTSSGAMLNQEWFHYGGAWYYFKDSGAMASKGWAYIQGKWYYFESSGVMKKNTWFFDRGDWYYLTNSGALLRDDWVYYGDSWYYFKGSGAMASKGWAYIQGKWYYLDSSGKMLRNAYTPDGYYVGSTGAWE